MIRPKEIHWFAWIQIASLLFGMFSTFTNWDVLTMSANQDAALSPDTVRSILLGTLIVGTLLSLLLLWFIWQRSNVARWIYIILSGLGILFGIMGLVGGEGTNPLSATMGQHIVGIILIVLLFLPDVRAWFAERPVDSNTFR